MGRAGRARSVGWACQGGLPYQLGAQHRGRVDRGPCSRRDRSGSRKEGVRRGVEEACEAYLAKDAVHYLL